MAELIGRNDRRYLGARKRILANATVCAICGGELDFNAPPRSRWSPSVDHIIPLSHMTEMDPATRRMMASEPSNLRPAHLGCNARRGAGRVTLPRKNSRKW